MLVSFSVANFRSFNAEQTLTMVASNKINDHQSHLVNIPGNARKLLRNSLLYGANSAGKSNLIRAMRTAQRIITQSAPISTATPFHARNQEDYPTSFEFRFLVLDHIFTYGFDIIQKNVASEWLTFLRGESDEVIFERTNDGSSKWDKTNSFLVKDLLSGDHLTAETLNWITSQPVRNDELVLSRALSLPEQARGRIVSGVLDWFINTLTICQVGHQTAELFDRLEDPQFTNEAVAFLKRVGTGIEQLSIMKGKRNANQEEARNDRYKRYSFDFEVHPVDGDTDIVEERRILSNTRLPFHFTSFSTEQSDGTSQLLNFLPLFIPPENHKDAYNKVIVIDELDRSLHPRICWDLIHFFNESLPASRTQLIASTHEAHLLNQELLRRDEYWFVEKDNERQSHLVPLSDFKLRNDIQLEKGYLQGRFGGIPIIGPAYDIEAMLRVENAAPVDTESGVGAVEND